MTITRARSFVLGCSVLTLLTFSSSGLAMLVLSGSSSRAEDHRPARQTESPKPESQIESPRPAPIDRNGVLILVRSALLALDEANKTGNYSVLRDLGAPGFREANSDARLAEIFASQRKENLDLSGVAVIDPQLTVLPQIEANGMMRMAGFFPSVPTQVNFELIYAPVQRQWRLFGLSVSLGQAGPVAPPSPEPPPEADPKSTAAPQAAVAPPKPAPKSNTHGQAAPPKEQAKQ